MEIHERDYNAALDKYQLADQALIQKIKSLNSIPKAPEESNQDLTKRLNKELQPFEKALKNARNHFHLKVVDYLIAEKQLCSAVSALLSEHVNFIWAKYIQHHSLLHGRYFGEDNNHWQDLVDEARDFKEIQKLIDFDTDNLKNYNFPITINYNGKQIAAIKSERLWIHIISLLEKGILHNHGMSLNSRLFVTKNNIQRFPEQLGIDEMTEEIYLFLGNVCSIKGKEKRILTITLLYNLLRIPLYVGSKAQYGSFEKQHIYNYLKRAGAK